MSELLQHQDIADDAFHEIQLSGKQLVFLFMATTIVAVVIFLCGVQVGRGVKAAPADTSDAVASATVPSVARATPQAAATTEPPATEPPAPPKDTDEDLSYAKRLQAEGQTAEKVKPRSDPPPAASSSAGPAAVATTAAVTPKEVAPPVKETPAKATAAAGQPARRVGRAGAGAEGSRRRRAARRSGWSARGIQRSCSARSPARRPSTACRWVAITTVAKPSRSRGGWRRKSSSSPGFRTSAPLGRPPRAQFSEVRPPGAGVDRAGAAAGRGVSGSDPTVFTPINDHRVVSCRFDGCVVGVRPHSDRSCLDC